jgi:MFS superfamily sulfate permease-like transporter
MSAVRSDATSEGASPEAHASESAHASEGVRPSAPPRRPSMAPPRAPRWDLHPLHHLRHDLPAGLVVFLVALPLCLGVALASGAPPLAGLIAGCVGGIVIPLVSRAPLSVSGPAAGLAAIVVAAVEHHGFPVVCAATLVAGGLQIGLGLLRAGFVVSFVQSSVIRGMLAAIGILLILKQVPHAIGYDHENFAGESFEVAGEGNTFALFFHALSRLEWGAVIISVGSLGVLWGWEAFGLKKKLPIVPAALIVVLLGASLAFAYPTVLAGAALDRRHFVDVPEEGLGALVSSLGTISWQALLSADTWILGAVLAIVASLESLLSLDAVDRLDPYKRRSDTNRELVAQGLGNAISGVLGGLPITSVIVRSGANVDAGGRTQAAAVTHGALLLGAILALAAVLNRIPLAALATILVWTGGKLAHPSIFRTMWKRGSDQLIPFVVTIVAIVFTDLLKGVVLGIVVGQAFNVRSAMRNAFSVEDAGEVRTIRFEKDIFFFHKAAILAALDRLPEGTKKVVVDAGASDYVELDVREAVHESRENVERQGATLEIVGIAPVEGALGH